MANRTHSEIVPRTQNTRKDESFHVLYVGAVVPKHSETFVTQEISGLRQRGLRVSVASVRQPEDSSQPELQGIAAEANVVYAWRVLKDAARGAFRSPRVLARGILDSVTQRDVTLAQRPKVLWQCLAGLSLAEHVKDQGIDHVHAHMANTPTGVAMYAARALGVPFSFTGHAADLFRHRVLLQRKLEEASFVACISEWHRRYYQEYGDQTPLDDSRLPIVRCGVQVNPRRRTGGARDGILSVGRLVKKKGFDVLLDALALFPAEERPRVTIVGDGPERANLERQVSALDLENHVRFYGWLPNQEVRNLLSRSTLCVLPCRVDAEGDRDGIPVALMEAMAEGVPVITGDLPAIRELVRNGESGILLPPDDVFALARAMRTLHERPDLRERLGAAGRRRVLEEFALQPNLDRLVEAFQSVHDHPALEQALFATTETVPPSMTPNSRRTDEDAPPRSTRKAIPPTAA